MDHAERFDSDIERAAGVFASSIPVKDDAGDIAAADCCGHQQGVSSKLGVMVLAKGPSRHPPRREI